MARPSLDASLWAAARLLGHGTFISFFRRLAILVSQYYRRKRFLLIFLI